MGDGPMLELLRKYSDYSAHVTRKVYCDLPAWDAERDAVENEWPEFRTSTLMLSKPSYQSDRDLAPTQWCAAYFNHDVEELQKRKQHHVHIPDEEGKRRPLDHCRDPKARGKNY